MREIKSSRTLYFFSMLITGIVLLYVEVQRETFAFRDFESFFYAGKDIVEAKSPYSLDSKKENFFSIIFPNLPNPFLMNNPIIHTLPNLPGLSETEKNSLDIFGIDKRVSSPFFVFPYIYPPVLAYILVPFVYLGIKGTYFLWLIFSFIALAFLPIFGEKFLQKYQAEKSEYFFSFGILVLLLMSFVIYDNFFWTQVNIFILSLLMLAFNYENEKPILAGFSFALACMIKMSPLLLGIYFLSRRSWKFLLSTIISLVCIFLITILFGGFGHWKDFFEIVADISKGDRAIRGLIPAETFGNFSLKGYIYRVFPPQFKFNNWLVNGIGIFFLLWSVLSFFKKWYHEYSDSVFLYRLLFLMYILSPIAWLHHMIFFFPVYLLFGIFIYKSPLHRNYKIGLSILFGISFLPAHLYSQYLPDVKNLYIINQLNSLNFLFLAISFFMPSILLRNPIQYVVKKGEM